MMKINFKKKLNAKLIASYIVMYVFIFYWYITFPPPPEYRAGPIIAAVVLPFLVIFTIKYFFIYWASPNDVQLDLKQKTIMVGSTQIDLGVGNRKLIIIANKCIYRIILEEDGAHPFDYVTSLFSRALYCCDLEFEALQATLNDLNWIIFIDE